MATDIASTSGGAVTLHALVLETTAAGLLGVGEAANAEEITQQSVSQEEPAYGRYETEYAHRERERHKECLY